MNTQCGHSLKNWYRQGDAQRIYARHPPSRGRHHYYLTIKAALDDQSPTTRFIATGLANYPSPLSTFIANKMSAALKALPPPRPVTPPPAQLSWGQRLGKERVIFTEKLRGNAEDEALAARQLAESLAVGGLRDALQSF